MKVPSCFVLLILLLSGCLQSSSDADIRNGVLPVPNSGSKPSDDANAKTNSAESDANDSAVSSPAPVEVVAGDAAAAKPPEERADSRIAAKDKEPVAVTFEDLNLNMQADIVFRPVMMTDRVRELEGKRIKLKGFMLSDLRQKGIKEFVLLKNTECKFGPGGQADHLAEVKMQGNASARFTNRPVEVEGVLRIEPYQGNDGNTWSIFQIEATSVRPG